MQIVRVLKEITDLLHQDAGSVQHDAHDGSHAENHNDASDSAPDDLSQGLLHLAGCVKGLSDDGGNGKAEGENDADQGHAPIDVADSLVGEENIDQIVGGAVVFYLDQAGKYLEHLIEELDHPAQDPLEVVKEPEDRGVEDALQNGA